MSRKKSSCSFGFCPNYLDPPPNLDNLYHFFWMPMCQKNWAGVSPSLPIPKLTQYIEFVKSGQKNWAGPPSPLLIWTKSKKTAIFFLETFPKMTIWSGATFILGWSCFKGACATMLTLISIAIFFVDWQGYLILQLRMVETSTIFLELRPEKYTSWCVILNSLLSRLSVLVAKFSYIGGSNSMSACLL